MHVYEKVYYIISWYFLPMQAVPYCWTLLYVPMHFLTVELLLFMTGVWTTNIHDCIHGRRACYLAKATATQQA